MSQTDAGRSTVDLCVFPDSLFIVNREASSTGHCDHLKVKFGSALLGGEYLFDRHQTTELPF